MNRELDEFVRYELAQIGACPLPGAAGSAVPAQLYHFADAASIDAFLCHGTLRALDWRLGWDGSLVSYGIELVKTYFGTRAYTPANPLRDEFRHGVEAHFHPRGAHFDGFVALLFEACTLDVSGPFLGYALGLSTASLPMQTDGRAAAARMRLLRAIYARDEQLSIVQTLYQRCEDYFVSAVERFGERYRDDLLFACCDRFCHDIGTFLMRFRDPVLRYQREWIAIALALPDDTDERVIFDIVDNRLVPAVDIDVTGRAPDGMQTSPLRSIAVSPSLPLESTREALLTYLRRKNVRGVTVVLAGNEDGGNGVLPGKVTE